MEMTTVIAIMIAHIGAHFFLLRFFKWYDTNSKLNAPWVKWFLLVPPIALVVAVILISLGLILQIFEKLKPKKK